MGDVNAAVAPGSFTEGEVNTAVAPGSFTVGEVDAAVAPGSFTEGEVNTAVAAGSFTVGNANSAVTPGPFTLGNANSEGRGPGRFWTDGAGSEAEERKEGRIDPSGAAARRSGGQKSSPVNIG